MFHAGSRADWLALGEGSSAASVVVRAAEDYLDSSVRLRDYDDCKQSPTSLRLPTLSTVVGESCDATCEFGTVA
jgi:hypothetical protein